jgi:hypothetical protein
VSAEAAADFAALLALGLLSVLAAAEAAFAPVASELRTWVRADAAADLAALLAVELRNTFDAAEAALLPVLSPLRFVIANLRSKNRLDDPYAPIRARCGFVLFLCWSGDASRRMPT